MLLKWAQYPGILLNRNNLGVETKSKIDQSIIIDSPLLVNRALKKWLWMVCELYLNKVVTEKKINKKRSDWVIMKD